MSVLLLRQVSRRRPPVGGGGPVGTETFTATTGSTWPADWVTKNGAGTGNQTIQGNKGRLSPSGGWASAWRTGMTAVTDVDLFVSLKATSGLVTLGIAPVQTSWNTPDNAHYFRMEPGATQMGYVSLRRHTAAGGHVELAFIFAGVAAHTTDGWRVRFQRVGTDLRAKVWTAGATEPGAWLIQVTDSSPPASLSGKVFLGCDTATDFDDLFVDAPSGGASGSGFGATPFGTGPFGA